MSKKVFANDIKVTLTEGVTIERANELRQLLVERLSEVAKMEPTLERVTIDLSQVSDIDACGCQLLALFVENLKQHGVTPATAAGAPLTERIDLLGFSDLLAGQPARPHPAGTGTGSSTVPKEIA